ncbi:hypothetical protein [Chromobacterium violaceum]|uniref:hypothetical protein n=1 Tax=Chromobacterium violaceum TaxID=536 RepID=UPI001B33D227|nr:hypothetical protein [Chromobacterium violaceum]MBP4045425.1 hypothetical protein [Chromobacterium violaceum]
MKKILLPIVLSVALLGGCSTAGLTSHTDVPLELKGLRTGVALERCPISNPGYTKREGRVLTCVLDEKSLGGAAVTNAGATALDGRILFVFFQLDRSGRFSQPEALRSLSEKFGSPARGARPRTYLWTHGNDQLVLDEIKGTVTLADIAGMDALHMVQAKDGSKDL